MSWFEKLMPSKIRVDRSKSKKVIPEGIWEKCPSCQTVLYREDIIQNIQIRTVITIHGTSFVAFNKGINILTHSCFNI